MSEDNKNPNENLNTQTDASTNASQTETTSTNASGTKKRSAPDKRFVWGAIAVLVLGGAAWYLFSSPGKKYVTVPISEVPPAPMPQPDPEPLPSYDANLPEESSVESDSSSTSDEEPAVEVTTDDGEKVELVSQKTGTDNLGGIGYVNYNEFKQKTIPQGSRRFVMGDEALITAVHFGGRQCPIYADSSLLYDVCQGSLRLPADKNEKQTRIEYAMQTQGRTLQFYHMPLCLISKTTWDGLLKEIDKAAKEYPDKNVEFNVPFTQSNEDIKKMAADQLNKIYGLKGDKTILKEQILTPPFNSFAIYIGSDTEPSYIGGNGEDVGIKISGKASDLQKKFAPIVRYQSSGMSFKVVYNVDGEIFQRNLQQETISRTMSIKNIYNYYKDRKIKFDSIDAIHAGGGEVNINCGVFSGTFGVGHKETYSRSELTGFVEESELNSFYVNQRHAIKIYYDNQFGKEPESVVQTPDWNQLFPNLTALVIPLKADGTLDIKPDDAQKAEKEKLFNDYWAQIKSKIDNSPEAVETLKKLLPNENISEGKGVVNVRADQFFGLDVVQKKFREGIKIYKLNQSDIDQGLEYINIGLNHIYGSYPVTASAVLFYGKTQEILEQGYFPLRIVDNNNINANGAQGNVIGEIKPDGKFYFVTSENRLPEDKTADEYCLGREDCGTTFSVSVIPSYDVNTKKVSAIVHCTIGPDKDNRFCKGTYQSKTVVTGTVPIDQMFSKIKYPETVKVGAILSNPEPSTLTDTNTYMCYNDTYKSVSLTGKLESRTVPGCDHGYNNMRELEDGFLEGQKHREKIDSWYFNSMRDTFKMNISYLSREKVNGVLNPNEISKTLVTGPNGAENTPAFIFEGEHHYAYLESYYINFWHRWNDWKRYRPRYYCCTYNKVGFRVETGDELQIPFVYAVQPAVVEYTVVGSIGGGAHIRLNSKTNEWEPVKTKDYNSRYNEVKNNVSPK